MAKPLIWINGLPGVGKLTIATALAVKDSSIKVIDNHKLIDPVAAKFPRDHPDYQTERKRVRQGCFDAHLYEDEHSDTTFVFTGKKNTYT